MKAQRKPGALLALAALATLAANACSSSNVYYGLADGGPPGPTEDAGQTEPDASSSSTDGGKDSSTTPEGDVNPYGVRYPTAGLGTSPRSGSKAGSIIRNLKFVGYKFENGVLDKSTGQKVQLADYFDPEEKLGIKALHIFGGAIWATPSEEQMTSMVAATAALESKGGVFLAVIGEGAQPGVASTESNLSSWATKHKPKFSIAIDPTWKALGGFFDAAAVPLNLNIDVRSMEILSSGVGAPPDIEADVEKWLEWVDVNPPANP